MIDLDDLGIVAITTVSMERVFKYAIGANARKGIHQAAPARKEDLRWERPPEKYLLRGKQSEGTSFSRMLCVDQEIINPF